MSSNKNMRLYKYNTDLLNFCKRWLLITTSMNKLRPSERDVLAYFLKSYYEYSKKITDEDLLWDLVFHRKNKVYIREELGVQEASFQNTMTALRKKKAIVNGKISPIYIPTLDDSNKFSLIFKFNIDEIRLDE